MPVGLYLLLWVLVNVLLVVLVVLHVDEYDRVSWSDVSGTPVVNGSAQQRVIVVLPLGNRVQVVVVSVILGYGYDHEWVQGGVAVVLFRYSVVTMALPVSPEAAVVVFGYNVVTITLPGSLGVAVVLFGCNVVTMTLPVPVVLLG